jgi:hypothetical protein
MTIARAAIPTRQQLRDLASGLPFELVRFGLADWLLPCSGPQFRPRTCPHRHRQRKSKIITFASEIARIHSRPTLSHDEAPRIAAVSCRLWA